MEKLKRAYCRTMVSEAKGFPATPTRGLWEGFVPVVPHMAEVVGDGLLQWIENEDLIWPFVGLGRFYAGQGAYAQAEPWYQQCLKVCRRRSGEEHPDVASSLNNLAALYDSQGRYDEA
ncbi:MAG: tetratricopeptide repeat protein, partial [Sphingobacteriaceae bacterium]|nr:tetratricopeptide repeat protein [Cytophagaceae bacterium]